MVCLRVGRTLRPMMPMQAIEGIAVAIATFAVLPCAVLVSVGAEFAAEDAQCG